MPRASNPRPYVDANGVPRSRSFIPYNGDKHQARMRLWEIKYEPRWHRSVIRYSAGNESVKYYPRRSP